MGRTAYTKMGIEQGTTWGTEVALGTNDQIAPLDLSPSRVRMEFLEDPSLLGSPWGNAGQLGAKAFEGTLSLRARYGYNIPKLLALAIGDVGTPSGGGPYTHPLTLANRLTKFLTLAAQRVANASTTVYDSVASAMVDEATLSFRGSDPGVLTLGLVGTGILRDAGTNGSTQFGNLTLPDSGAFVLPTDGVFRCAAASGTTLSSTHNLKPSEIEIRIRRNLSRDFKVEGTGIIGQPIEADVSEVTVMLAFPGLGGSGSFTTDPDEFMDRFEAGTELKSTLTFTKDSNNIWAFEFPRLQVIEAPDWSIPASGRYPHRVRLRALVASSAPTGMTVTQPMKLTVTDQLSAAYLS